MSVNDFIVKLKADGSEKDWLDLEDISKQYQMLSGQLTTKDKGPFAVNVLCILCRNIEKVPSWLSSVDLKALLNMAIECMRCARYSKELRMQTLTCAYHLHKCLIKQTSQQLPPELILKLSYMPFENTTETLPKEYCTIYGKLLGDRLVYIEKLKAQNLAIHKIFTKLTEDVLKVVQIYETVVFCSTMLKFIVLKLHALYSENLTKELNHVFGKIFQCLSWKRDLDDFKKLSKDQVLDIYGKFNECLYFVAENSSKMNFKDSVLSEVVNSCVSILGHDVEILHCFQTFYLNTFCVILTYKSNVDLARNTLTLIQISCESMKQNGYEKTLKATLPVLDQFLRLYIDYFITNKDKLNWTKYFNENTQEILLNVTQYIMDELKTSNQQVKCDCKVKTGLHDALRLSFCIKNLITTSIEIKIDVTKTLPIYYSIVEKQYSILQVLCSLGCCSYKKYFRKLQADIHNIAVMLNNAKQCDYSIKLFDIYIQKEIQHFKSETDLKSISRALYNKSICELESQLHDTALKDAYLSIVFAQPECFSSDKHMSLVMDIKAKALKAREKEKNEDCVSKSCKTNGIDGNEQNGKNNKDVTVENDGNSKDVKNQNDENIKDERIQNGIDEKENDDLQLLTVLDACKVLVNGDRYGNLKPFFCNLKFSTLLKHEFTELTKLWPSVVPIAGVWRSLLRLMREEIPWLKVEDDSVRQTLYEIILETTSSVRTIHNEYYCQIVKELVEEFDNTPPKTLEQKTIYASLLFLQSEYELHEASNKYGWNVKSVDDECQINRTMEQEHVAISSALRALAVWMDLYEDIEKIPSTAMLCRAVDIACMFVPILSQLDKTMECLQLAHVCCRAANAIRDKAAYLRNVSTILHCVTSPSKQIEQIIDTAKLYLKELIQDKDGMETALVFLCELSMYYAKIGEIGASARIVQQCQAYLLDACQKSSDVKVNMATGKLLEAQSLLCTENERSNAQSMLSAVNATHRHYVTTSHTGRSWSAHRYATTTIKRLRAAWGVGACARAAHAALLRRAKAAALITQGTAAAVDSAKLTALTANTYVTDDTRVKIDNRLKYILGLPTSDQTYSETIQSNSKPAFTPKHEIETMLEDMTFRRPQQLSPSVPPKVPAFNAPDFFTHGSKCTCYACQTPASLSLMCQTLGMEASMYFRAKEFDIAKNYFDGCVKCFPLAESKLKGVIKKYRDVYESYLVDAVEKVLCDDFRYVQMHVLIENAFFELSQNNDREVDEKIVAIHDILQEYKDVDAYLRNEVFNLLVATAKLRKHMKKLPEVNSLEIEMERLKLSPIPNAVCPKTPETKRKKPPVITKHIVGADEVPNSKRKVIKLNLDEDLEETEKEVPKRTSRRTNIKIPVLVVPKPELEMITPKPKRRLKTKTMSLDENVTNNYQDFATPLPKSNAKHLDVSDSFDDFATPKPKTKCKIPVADINVASLEQTTQKTKRTLTKMRTLDADLERTTCPLEKTSLKSESSVLEFATPKPKSNVDEFFTPIETSAEQFFTPVTTLKTYKKKPSLHAGIIKNLEKEFSTPKIAINDSEISSNFDFTAPSASLSRTKKVTSEFSTPKIFINDTEISHSNIAEVSASKSRPKTVETGSMRSLKDKRSLKRATSPGKLEKSEKKQIARPERVTRLRKPVRFSIESPDDDFQ